MHESGERHETDALIAVLLEESDLLLVRAAGRLAGEQGAQVDDVLPAEHAARNRLDEISLLVVNRLLPQGRDDDVGPPENLVVQLAPRPVEKAFLNDFFIAGHD